MSNEVNCATHRVQPFNTGLYYDSSMPIVWYPTMKNNGTTGPKCFDPDVMIQTLISGGQDSPNSRNAGIRTQIDIWRYKNAATDIHVLMSGTMIDDSVMELGKMKIGAKFQEVWDGIKSGISQTAPKFTVSSVGLEIEDYAIIDGNGLSLNPAVFPQWQQLTSDGKWQGNWPIFCRLDTQGINDVIEFVIGNLFSSNERYSTIPEYDPNETYLIYGVSLYSIGFEEL